MGENDREGLTDDVFAAGYLSRCRNYHVIERGKLQKRQGYSPFVASAVNGSADPNGIFQYEFGNTRNLIGAAGGKVKYLTGSTWTDFTGSQTVATGKDNRIRFAQYHDGRNGFLIVCDENNGIYRAVPGSGSLEHYLGGGSRGPSQARDVAVFYGFLFFLNTTVNGQGPTALEWGPTQGVLVAEDWNDANVVHCSRRSDGMALTNHGSQVLLIFHRQSIHFCRFVPEAGETFAFFDTAGGVGLAATDSVVHSKGVTYFCYDDGPYRIRNPEYMTKDDYIGGPIEDFWGTLNKDRIQHIYGFERGEPWNEVVWLVSTGSSTEHDAALVYNTVQGTWSIFNSPNAAYHRFNVGCTFRDASNDHTTVLFDYNGIAQEAWGDENNASGYLDANAAAVASELRTGLLDLGYEGQKRLREIWVDILTRTEKEFTAVLTGIEENPTLTLTGAAGVSGGQLSVNFFFASQFASDSPTALRIAGAEGEPINAKSRYFQLKLTEEDTGEPHTINSTRWLWVPRAVRMKP